MNSQSVKHLIQSSCLAVLVLGSACKQDDAQSDVNLSDMSSPDFGGVPGVSPQVVLNDVDLDSVGRCYEFAEGERLIGVSPEGDAWVASSGPSLTTMLRVLSPLNSPDNEITSWVVPLSEVTAPGSLSESTIDLVADNALWRVEGGRRTSASSPIALEGKVTSLCGSVADGMLLVDGTMYEPRDGVWWSWSPTQGASSPMRLLSQDGACTGPEGTVLAAGSDPHDVWLLDPPVATRFTYDEPWSEVVASTGQIAFVSGEKFFLGTPDRVTSWSFMDGIPAALSATGGDVWMSVGERLVRHDGSSFTAVRHDLTGSIDTIKSFYNGAWVASTTHLCQQRLGISFRVRGIAPNQRLNTSSFVFEVFIHGDDGQLVEADAGAPTVMLDQEPLSVEPHEDGGYRVSGQLMGAGSHTLTLSLGEEPEQSRTLHVVYEPEMDDAPSWAEDIEPIFAASCAGSACHGPQGASIELNSYALWLEHATKIEERVVETKTMPPLASQAAFPESSLDTIEAWISTQMNP